MNTPGDFLKGVLDPETVRRFFSGMNDVEIVVLRCYFNNNFILMKMILMNKVVRHIFGG